MRFATKSFIMFENTRNNFNYGFHDQVLQRVELSVQQFVKLDKVRASHACILHLNFYNIIHYLDNFRLTFWHV